MSAQDEFRKRTLARLQSIKSHLETSPRASRLKDKVCIITGVGSLKGIGYPFSFSPHASFILLTAAHTGAPLLSSLLTKVPPSLVYPMLPRLMLTTRAHITPGARHLYLSDFDPTNLSELKATIEKLYPDVKVSARSPLCLLTTPTFNVL